MQNTFDIYNERKKELDLYYAALVEIENNKIEKENNVNHNKFIHIYNADFSKILKSNFILLIYNLIEAVIVNAFQDIYNNIKKEKCNYNLIIPEIKNLWSKKQLKLKENKNKNKHEIIDTIINDIIELSKEHIEKKGNFDDNVIRSICKEHGIKYSKCDGSKLGFVKNNRINLAHGIMSFSECGRDLTTNDLKEIMDSVLKFIESILNDMKEYHDNKLFLIK